MAQGFAGCSPGNSPLIYADTRKEQVVGTGEYFHEPGDVNINGVNRGKEPAKLVIVELVPAGLKGSAMVPARSPH